MPTGVSLTWEVFVRDVLSRLSEQLNAGLLTLHVDGERIVVDAPVHGGRGIVVPTNQRALVPPLRLPARSSRGLFSDSYITHDGKDVDVPSDAIVRDYGQALLRTSERIPPPEAVVVLRSRSQAGEFINGWYVRYARDRRRLVKVDETTCNCLAIKLRDCPVLRASSLLSKFIDSSCDFNAIAARRFGGFRERVMRAVLHAKTRSHKRKRNDASITPPPPPPALVPAIDLVTCLICLEDKSTSLKRCRHAHCGAHVCEDCHAASRGLCPLCDRSAINANYPCSCCNTLTRLPQYGFQCTGCDAASLCESCYCAFGACVACDV